MPQCQFLFSAFLYFKKFIQEIFSELDETKAKPPIFSHTKTDSKAETEEGTEAAHHRVARAHLWPHHRVVWAPRVPSDIAIPPIKCL
jgi:hypothetical protein